MKRFLVLGCLVAFSFLLSGCAAKQASRVHYDLAREYHLHGSSDKAIEEYKKTLELDPKFPEAHYNIGVILYYQGKIDDAIEEFLQEIEVNPIFSNVHYNLALAYYRKGELDDALDSLSTTLKLNPKDDEARRLLKMIEGAK
jgi:superkiller protein 3